MENIGSLAPFIFTGGPIWIIISGLILNVIFCSVVGGLVITTFLPLALGYKLAKRDLWGAIYTASLIIAVIVLLMQSDHFTVLGFLYLIGLLVCAVGLVFAVAFGLIDISSFKRSFWAGYYRGRYPSDAALRQMHLRKVRSILNTIRR